MKTAEEWGQVYCHTRPSEVTPYEWLLATIDAAMADARREALAEAAQIAFENGCCDDVESRIRALPGAGGGE